MSYTVIMFRDSEKYNPWFFDAANDDNSSYTAVAKDLIDVVEMELDADSSSNVKALTKKEAKKKIQTGNKTITIEKNIGNKSREKRAW